MVGRLYSSQRYDESAFCNRRLSSDAYVYTVHLRYYSFNLYIKPQPGGLLPEPVAGCNSFYFYIKPQHVPDGVALHDRCNSFYFYIKPQPLISKYSCIVVVIHSISTSNHNLTRAPETSLNVVIHSISTSNHNFTDDWALNSFVVIHSISTSNHN